MSVACMIQLRPATKPPQLYRPDTNIQMLLDLMVNYSSQGVSWEASSYISVGTLLYAERRFRFELNLIKQNKVFDHASSLIRSRNPGLDSHASILNSNTDFDALNSALRYKMSGCAKGRFTV